MKVKGSLKLTFLFITALALAALLGSATPAVAADQVPLKGTLFLVSTPAGACNNGLLFAISELGNFSHLGAVTARGSVCLQSSLHFTGEATYTAANGDSISGTFSGRLAPVSATLFQLQGETLTITGGTGRFAGASGEAAVTGSVDLATGEGVHQFDGTISSVGSTH